MNPMKENNTKTDFVKKNTTNTFAKKESNKLNKEE